MSSYKEPNKAVIERLRREYPAGTRVELIDMDELCMGKLHPGSKGTVTWVDDIGSICVDWDEGSSLNVIYGIDHVKKL